MRVIEEAPAQLFDAAMADFRAGNRARAQALCRRILDAAPQHPDANHLLGVILYLEGDAAAGESFLRAALGARESAQACTDFALTLKAQQRHAEAARALRRAIELSPAFVLAHQHLGRVLEEQGDIPGAQSAFRRALDLDPQAADTCFRLGKLYAVTGRLDEARGMLERAVALRPNHAEARNSLGTVLAELGLLAEAEAAFRRAVEIKPGFAEALCNLGMLLEETKRLDEAEAALRSAASADSQFAGASEALAKLMSRLGRTEEAIVAARQTIALKPDDAGAHNAFAALLAEEKRFEEAEPLLRRAIELDPKFTAALSNLGNVLMETGRHAESEGVFRRALEIDPHHWGALYNFVLLLKNIRELDEAETVSRRVIELRPRMSAAYVGLGNVLIGKASGDISEALNCFRRAIELDPDCQIAHSNLVYMLNFVSETGLDVLEEGRRFSAHFEAPHMSEPVAYRNDFTSSRRLRIGYVSPDFRNHCQALFMLPLLRNHDHEAVEVFCYSSVARPDDVTRHMMQLADVWRDVHTLNDERLASQIREDRIDVLVDLTMHMSNGRPLLFRRRAAPVQVAWLAYPGTTGSSAIGYRLTDPWLDPPGSTEVDARNSERTVRLPDTFWCYDPMTASIDVGPLPALTEGHITFGCLNNPCKLNDQTFGIWAEVLRQVEGSRVILLLSQGQARERVSAKFAAMGVDPARFTFMDYQQRETYLKTYQKIDIVLDTFPYNGHTTSLDALWMGVPVVSLTGKTPASRAGYSLLSNLDLQNLTSNSAAEFVGKAIELASDRLRLLDLRSTLRAKMQGSALMDGARFAAHVESAFRQIWAECGASRSRAQKNHP